MNKNKLLFKTLAAFFVMVMVVTSLPINKIILADEEAVKLTIIHINDRHGKTQAEPYISQKVKDLKAEGENVLVLDAGDSLHGQTTAILTEGESMVNIMNQVGYDAMVPGNHDFNYGVERLKKLSENMNFSLLAANVKNEEGNNLFQPYHVFAMEGITVGVFGIVTPETLTKSDPRIVAGLTFQKPEETAIEMVEELRQEDCDVIIALTHLGEDTLSDPENKSDTLASVPGIDIIVDGHSHTVLESGRTVDDTLIVQTGDYAQNIGVVEVSITDQIKSKTAKLIAVPKEGEETSLRSDIDVVAKIAEEDTKLEEITSKVVGDTPVFLNAEWPDIRMKETNLADLITDSMKYETDADIAFLTGGNIRASIKAGKITMGQLITTLPWFNLIIKMELKGVDILKMLEHGVKGYPDPVGSYIHISGMRCEFNPDAPPMNRITNVIMKNGEKLKEDAVYKVATIEYLAFGGDGYSMMANGTNLTYYQSDVETLIKYLATDPTINEGAEERVLAKIGGSDGENPIESSTPTPTAKPSSKPTPQLPTTVPKAVVGKTYKVKKIEYKVLKVGNKTGTVALLKANSRLGTKIKIPNTIKVNGFVLAVTEISNNAFKNNKTIKSITLGKNITKIKKQAFRGCTSLKKIEIQSIKLKQVGNGAFKGINGKAVIKVPIKKLSKYKRLINSNKKSKSIKIKV